MLGLLAGGQTSAEAAATLGIGEETVQTHVRRAMAKLSARTRTEAVATSLRLGLLDGAAALPLRASSSVEDVHGARGDEQDRHRREP